MDDRHRRRSSVTGVSIIGGLFFVFGFVTWLNGALIPFLTIGALIFLPAAMLRTCGVFLAGLFVLGTGLTILQTAANPYIVQIGPASTAAVRISIMGLLNKGAGVVAP